MSARRVAKPAVNEALREHVTSIGFDLSMRKTHIAALVRLDLSLAANDGELLYHDHLPRGHRLAPAFSNFVTGLHGLERRGLIKHTMPQSRRPDVQPIGEIWTVTVAGNCVIGLLKEAGIYQEFAEALTSIRAAS